MTPLGQARSLLPSQRHYYSTPESRSVPVLGSDERHPSTGVGRCTFPSCQGLTFVTMDDLRSHQDNHFSILSDKWKEQYGCTWDDCRSQKRNRVFRSKTAFRKHLRTHFKSHWCEYPGCDYDKPFGSRCDVERHMNTKYHTSELTCKFPSCSFAFARQDKLDLHTRNKHPSSYCAMDHCGKTVLDMDRDDHFNVFHNGKPIESLGYTENRAGVYECALPGCESSVSRFNSTAAKRHLQTSHCIDY